MDSEAICADAIEPAAHSVYVSSLRAVSGRLLAEARGSPIAVLEIADGYVRVAPVSKAADALIVVAERSDLWQLLAGEINPVSAAIRGRLALYGNLAFALRVLLALHATDDAEGASYVGPARFESG